MICVKKFCDYKPQKLLFLQSFAIINRKTIDFLIIIVVYYDQRR